MFLLCILFGACELIAHFCMLGGGEDFSNNAENIRCRLTKFSHMRFMHPLGGDYSILHFVSFVLGEEPLAPIESEAGWIPEPFWLCCRREISV
jgi:hypothetical protein